MPEMHPQPHLRTPPPEVTPDPTCPLESITIPPLSTPEPAPMLEVHAPHETVHTWKDFFIHMATIVLGLLIAIGLEQTVEAIHHSRQRRELRESLERESRQILKDSIETEAAESVYVTFDEQRIAQLREAASGHGPFPGRPPNPKTVEFYFPDDPIWRSAKTSGLVDLLTQPEINAYSEIELLIVEVQRAANDTGELVGKQNSFEEQLPRQKGSSEPDFSVLSAADRRQYLALFSDLAAANRGYRAAVENTRGAEEAILHGERDLNAILKAERTYKTNQPN